MRSIRHLEHRKAGLCTFINNYLEVVFDMFDMGLMIDFGKVWAGVKLIWVDVYRSNKEYFCVNSKKVYDILVIVKLCYT